ncbi:MAG: M23 family metallopeptidase, partial [Chlorobiales bacterium]|nr:M23 family metallopeptidase [Chlorobiales bacterium]
MIATNKEKNKDKWYNKLRDKYRLVIMNDITFEERLSFRLTRLNVLILLSITAVLLIGLTILLIAFTPLREYIPGYTDVTLNQRVYELQSKADSMERIFYQRELYIQNIKNIMEGKLVQDTLVLNESTDARYDSIQMQRSIEDSLLRAEYDQQNKFDLYYDGQHILYGENSPHNINFFKPLDGIITNGFSLAENHLGIDIVANKNETVKATMDGTVIFSDWTVETGHVIAIQHQRNYISIYKHNSAIFKKTGSFVKAGDPIGIIGETGELSTGPHL